jgi:hypothetical protein
VDTGIHGAMWASALIASAFTVANVSDALQVARRWIPPPSRLRAAQDRLFALHAAGASWE